MGRPETLDADQLNGKENKADEEKKENTTESQSAFSEMHGMVSFLFIRLLEPRGRRIGLLA